MPQTRFADVQYQGVGGLNPGRSVLDLSHSYAFDGKFGYLYPVVCEEVVPGDVIKYGAEVLARMNPSVVPFMHEVNISWHAFFVPYRLVWPKVDTSGDNWESYITGDTWDPTESEFVPVTAVLPVWQYLNTGQYAKGSLYDFFGFQPGAIPADGHKPHALWNRAYRLIWNEWYRDQDLQEALNINDIWGPPLDSALEKDYFTSCRPFQQKGIAPALPITGSAVFDYDVQVGADSDFDDQTVTSQLLSGGKYEVRTNDTTAALLALKTSRNGRTGLDANQLSGASVTMSDLRLSMQIQKYLERNARAGNRYTEWLQSHYGVSPSDERLQRPEYLGGGKVPVIISEVLQTSQTSTTPQGTMAGHGISVTRKGIVNGYRATEFGCFMVLARILPRTMYTTGIHRRAIRNSPYEFYHPEFAHLSEQAVTNGELKITGGASGVDNQIFGYQARYQEYRTRNSVAVGEMRDTLKMWNLGRAFTGAISLNEDFISVTDSQRSQWMTRAFAVTSQAPFLVTFGNNITMSRPMPGLPEPGLMDHF